MLLSLIIPFYNASETIPNMLKSIEQQTDLEDIEFIFIDDGSDDKGYKIISSFLSDHPYITYKFIHLPHHEGVSTAYAAGLSVAEGDYVGRLDADDAFEPNALKIMLDAAISNDSDVVCASYFDTPPGKKKRLVPFPDNRADLNLLPICPASFALWNKIIRRSLLKAYHISTIAGIDCWEDLFITSRIFALTDKITVLHEPIYHYTSGINRQSVTGRSKNSVLHDRISYAEALDRWFNDKKLSVRYKPFLDRMKFAAKIKYLQTPDRNLKLWKHTFPEVNSQIMYLKEIPIYVRLGARIISLLPF